MNNELLKKMFLQQIEEIEKSKVNIKLYKNEEDRLQVNTEGSLPAIIYTIVAFENSIIKRYKGSKAIFEWFRELIELEDEEISNE